MTSPLPRSKAEAEQVGSSLYLTGVPCKNGHNAPRLGEIRKRTGLRIDTAAAVLYLGCSLDALREHLERQFQPGMTWDNWGRQGWHIDHIKPLLHFDLEDEGQLRIVCHYTNLQPLWWRDNIVKGHVERGHTIRAGRR